MSPTDDDGPHGEPGGESPVDGGPEDGGPAGLDQDDGDNVAGVIQTIVVGITGVAALVVGLVHQENPVSAVLLAGLVAVAGWLSVIDLVEHRLPNRIVGPLALAVTISVMAAGIWTDDIGRSGRALLLGLVAAAFFLIGNLVGGMGMGDVKYAYPLGASLAWFGTDPLITAALITLLSGGLVAVVVLLSGRGRRYRIPYGPFMSLGLIAGLLTAVPGL